MNLLPQQSLSDGKSNSGIQLLFISACQSRGMADYIQETLRIPVVISINSTQEILDTAASDFSKEFYNYLIQGYTPKQAFEVSQYIITSNPEYKSLCRNHEYHEKWCPFTYIKKLNVIANHQSYITPP